MCIRDRNKGIGYRCEWLYWQTCCRTVSYTHLDVYKRQEDNNVSVKQIKQWVREERLVFSEDSPLGLECEGCGTIIKTGRFCEKCKRKMETDFQSVIKKKPVEPQLDKRPKERDKMRYL